MQFFRTVTGFAVIQALEPATVARGTRALETSATQPWRPPEMLVSHRYPSWLVGCPKRTPGTPSTRHDSLTAGQRRLVDNAGHARPPRHK